MKAIAHLHRLGSARAPDGESWREDRLAAAYTVKDPSFNRLTPTCESQLPAHARTPKHKSIGRLATIHSSSIKAPIARSSIVRRVSHTSDTSRNCEHRASQNRTKRVSGALSGRASHPPLAARSQINPTSSNHPNTSPSAHSTSRNCEHEPASQNRMEETRVCLHRMGLRERTDMDAHVGGYCRAQGEPCAGPDPENASTLRADGRTGYCATDAVRRARLRAVTSGAETNNQVKREYSTSDDDDDDGIAVGRSLAMKDATDKVNDNHKTAKTTITTTVPIRGWFAGGTETDRVWHSSISGHSFKLTSTCSAGGSPCVVLRERA
ncbi:hypothetical protein D9611_013164 [Ephemerocybe angulata]|uniref:Uncharacterized protein n=1 Tax=Ephemerocybe angulata TaxID=980116 RepID=A0A8H5FAG3_9AGAR|nr:hypothetical protein D9611_013164 [Tulosesus angulatus]